MSLGFSSNALRKAVHPTILTPASMKQGRAGMPNYRRIAVELLSHAFPTWQSLLGVKRHFWSFFLVLAVRDRFLGGVCFFTSVLAMMPVLGRILGT